MVTIDDLLEIHALVIFEKRQGKHSAKSIINNLVNSEISTMQNISDRFGMR